MGPATTPTTKHHADSERIWLDAWRTFALSHSRLLRELDEELQREHGVALGDYDVLVNLANAPRRRLRMCDLASQVLLSPSGISRRVERLEREGLVRRERAAGDARNVEAQLTQAGARLLRRLRATHRAGIRVGFADHYTPEELDALREMLERLMPDADRSSPTENC